MKSLILFSMFACTLGGAGVRAQDTLWTRAYGGDANDYLQAVRLTGDGGYQLCGATESFGAGGGDVYLVRIDAGGDTLWTRTYGGPELDAASAIDRIGDGGFILAGETASFGAGDHDVYLLRTDADGDTLWTRTIGGPSFERGSGVVATTDGRFVIGGRTSSFGAGDHDAYLVITDAQGNVLSTHTYGDCETDIAFAVQETRDGGFILAGVTNSSGAGGFDYYLVKTDRDGGLEWSETYGGEQTDWCHYVVQTSDDGFLLVGSTHSWGSGNGDVYLVKTGNGGEIQWTRVYGGPHSDGANSALQTPDGGYLVASFSGDFSAGWGDIYLLRTDAEGDTLWTQTYGRGGADNRETPGEIRPTDDGHYILPASSEAFGNGIDDAWILKLADDALSRVSPEVGDDRQSASPRLLENYPNPFTGETHIPFSLPRAGRMTIGVYDLLGRKVAHLGSGWMPAGVHVVSWNGAGRPSTFYFVRLVTEDSVSSRKLMLR